MKKLILASGSPRRQQLLTECGLTFEVRKPDVDESWPEHLPPQEVAEYLAKKKAAFFKPVTREEIIVTADTTVIQDRLLLNKPEGREDAFRMLSMLSGKTHKVITGICIVSCEHDISFSDQTEVTFRSLTSSEIAYYIDRYAPFDKAGAYGIQEWIGLIGVEKINGSYFNVMGLPTHRLIEELGKIGLSCTPN